MEYIKGRWNLACTVFFPIKCGNNCPFCNTKGLYNNFELEPIYLAKIFDSIRIANKSDVIHEFVLTGGEPLINLALLKDIIQRMEKPIYINTSLPNIPEIDETIEYINNEPKIKGVNISRHLNCIYNTKVCGKDKIDAIKKYKRINCIIEPKYIFEEEKLFNFIDVYGDDYTMVNFRADYRIITPDTLKNNDLIHEWLMKHFRFEYSSNCLVCNSEFFSDKKGRVICYHRGLENSMVETPKYTYINDVLISIRGNIYPNWDFAEDNKYDFVEWLKNYKENNI